MTCAFYIDFIRCWIWQQTSWRRSILNTRHKYFKDTFSGTNAVWFRHKYKTETLFDKRLFETFPRIAVCDLRQQVVNYCIWLKFWISCTEVICLVSEQVKSFLGVYNLLCYSVYGEWRPRDYLLVSRHLTRHSPYTE